MNQPIKYSNAWEDAQVVVSICSTRPNAKIVCIGSSGDNALALLTSHPSEIIVVDRDENQLHLIALKMAAIRHLDHAGFLSFIGVHTNDQRVATYTTFAHTLTEKEQHFWNTHLDLISKGIIHSGKMERFFQSFRKVLRFIHPPATYTALFTPKRTDEEQHHFYHSIWNNWRWRLYYYLVYNPLIFGRKARRSEYLKQVRDTSMSKVFLDRAHRHYASSQVQNNHLVEYMIYSNYKTLLPFYLRAEQFDQIKQSLGKITLRHNTVAEVCHEQKAIDCFVLSDIFEYMSPSSFKNEIEHYYQSASPNALFIYWNLLVDRKMHLDLPEKYAAQEELMQTYGPRDLGYFYDGLTISYKKA
jgi:S-adenosylmethionine-diacylglycerol 3-amino-3-carboxypropyl transferase